MNKPITPEQMDKWVDETWDRCQQETEEERILWEKHEAAMEKIKQNPAILKMLKNLKDK